MKHCYKYKMKCTSYEHISQGFKMNTIYIDLQILVAPKIIALRIRITNHRIFTVVH